MFDQLGRWLRRRQGIERNPIYRLAADVRSGRLNVEAAYAAMERPALLNQLADGDLWELEREATRIATDEPEHALVILRLVILAARYKGFDRVLVESNLRAADLLAELGEDREQELHLREAQTAADRIAYVTGKRRALARLARLAFERGETELAREMLSRQLDSGREDADTLEDVETALLLGDLARSDGDPGAAREFYHRAARSARRVGHFSGVVDALLRQVVVLRELGDIDDAVLLLQQAQEAAERTIDTRLQAEIAIQTGALLAEKHQYQHARTHLLTGLERARGMSDITMESRCLTGLARVERRAGHHSSAAEHYAQLADLEQRLGNRSAAVRALLDAAELRIDLREPTESLALLEQARPLAEALEDPLLRQRLQGLLGLSYGALERRGEAIDNLMSAIREARRLGDLELEGRWLLGMSEILLEFGEIEDATASARRAIELAQQHHQPTIEAQALALIGSINLSRRLFRDAEECLQRALGIARHLDDSRAQLNYLQVLAEIGRYIGQPQVTLRFLRQALDIATVHSGPETCARLHGQMAQLHRSMNQLHEAEEHYRWALSAGQEAGSTAIAARAWRGLAQVQDSAGRFDAAAESYEQAAALAEELGNTGTAATLRYNLGAILLEFGRLDDAHQQINRALELAMKGGHYDAADAARGLLRQIQSRRNEDDQSWGEDLLLDEAVVADDAERLRDALRS